MWDDMIWYDMIHMIWSDMMIIWNDMIMIWYDMLFFYDAWFSYDLKWATSSEFSVAIVFTPIQWPCGHLALAHLALADRCVVVSGFPCRISWCCLCFSYQIAAFLFWSCNLQWRTWRRICNRSSSSRTNFVIICSLYFVCSIFLSKLWLFQIHNLNISISSQHVSDVLQHCTLTECRRDINKGSFREIAWAKHSALALDKHSVGPSGAVRCFPFVCKSFSWISVALH